ncbi:hypothetical protein A2U01_0089993, partial [Trifolium medium]|nr:hypothetical protein [Trifolium medium]
MASLYLDPIDTEKSHVDETMVRSVGETLTQEGSEIQNSVTPTTDGCDIPKIDGDTDVENMVDQA